MRTLTMAALCLAPAMLIAPSSRRGAECAEAALRIALVLPAGEFEAGIAAEISCGATLAAAASNDLKAGGAKRPTVEVVPISAAHAAAGAAAVDRASKEKFTGVVAFVTDAAAIEMEAAARKAKLPLVLVGPGGPMRTIDAADPILRVEPSAADRGLQLAELLRFRSGRSSIGLPAQTQHAWIVVEDAPWAHAIEASLRTDDVDGIVTAGAAVVTPGGEIAAGDVAKARSASCDRVVVLGGAKTVRATSAALERAGWDAPMLCLDTALDGAATLPSAGARRKTAYLAATPTWLTEQRLEDVIARHPPDASKAAAVTPAMQRGFVATLAIVKAFVAQSKKGVVGGLRDEHEGGGANEAPLFDPTGSVDHWRWATWATGADGAAAPIKPAFLPDASAGLLLGGCPGARFRAVPGATCVRLGFGGGAGPPRTIEADLKSLGLSGPDTKANEMARDQIVARACSKLSRVWCRSYDGSARPAYSFRIAFVPEGTDPNGASAVWDGVIAGDGPDGLHGGQAFPKQLRAQALSTYLLRNASLLHKAKLTPPLAATDVRYLDGSYAWNTSAEDNTRSDRIRALIDGVASTYCMKLSKEIGHLAGLGVDHSGEPRSVMVAKGGEGVSDEVAYFPAAFAKVLEKTLGRVGTEGR